MTPSSIALRDEGYRLSQRHDPDELALLATFRCQYCGSRRVELRTYRNETHHVSYVRCAICLQSTEL